MDFNDTQRFELIKLYSELGTTASKEYDTRLFWLSGGAISLSAAGAQALKSEQSLVLVPALGIGVLFLLAAMAVTMLSFTETSRGAGHWIAYHLRAEDESLERARACTAKCELYAAISLCSVLAGVASIGVFYLANLTT